MVIKATLKIEGTKPNFDNILPKFQLLSFSVEEKPDCTFLRIEVPTVRGLMEIKRRCGNKRGRRGSKVTIASMQRDDGLTQTNEFNKVKDNVQ